MNCIKWAAAFATALVLSACGGGGGEAGTRIGGGGGGGVNDAKSLFFTAPPQLNLALSESQVFTVSGGTAGYFASSSQPAVAVGGLNGDKLTVGALSEGVATIYLYDSTGESVSTQVTVKGLERRALFTTAQSSVVVPVGSGSGQSYVVGGGTAPYVATSSDTRVVQVDLSGTTLTFIGQKPGSARVEVADAKGEKVAISVEVPVPSDLNLFTTAPSAITVAIGASPTYSVGGGSTTGYTATSSNEAVATVSLTGSTLTVNGLTAGTATVQVRDSAGATVSIAVTVPVASNVALFTTAPASVSLAVGGAGAQTYGITGGTAPYTVTTSNPSSVTVSQTTTSFTVTGAAVGAASIVIRDSLGTSVDVSVTVISSSTVALFTSAPATTSLAVGATYEQTYSIGGGTAPYTVSSSDASVASATLGAGGNTMIVRGNILGTASIVVRDSVGSTVTIAMTVLQPGVVLQLLPAEFSISEKSSNDIDLSIYGGAAPYRGFTDNLTSTSVTVNGSTLRVGVGSGANRCVAPSGTATSVSVILTVIDSAGASAISRMTIVNEAVCP